jgi:hypothetical protein
MLCQNAPFAPIYDSWKYGRDHGAGMPVRRHKAGRTRAHELANAQPPFHVQGAASASPRACQRHRTRRSGNQFVDSLLGYSLIEGEVTLTRERASLAAFRR